MLLRTVAGRLKNAVRDEDLITRWGGDEFILVFLGLWQVELLAQKAQTLLSAMAEPYSLDGKEVFVPISIGIAVYPEFGENAESLVRCADLALYHAKNQGRNNYQFFTPDMERRAKERFHHEADLRKAISNNEFFLEYQPQVSISSGELVGVEALIRWNHPTKGRIAPAEFIPLAEEIGLIVDIGEWVLKEACFQNKQWQASGYPRIHIAVNLSGKQFLKPDFPHFVMQILRETEMDPHYLELEITETVLAQDTHQCIEILTELKRLGLNLSVDDFGTGYSSLSYLKRFPIDLLKIDQSFIHECHITPEDSALCSAIISLALNLNMKTIAEGVERQEQLDFLQIAGCHFYQGYLFSKPESAEAITQMLDNQNEKGPNRLQK